MNLKLSAMAVRYACVVIGLQWRAQHQQLSAS